VNYRLTQSLTLSWLRYRGTMQNDKAKAVKLTPADMAVVEAVRNKLGLRSVSEVLRMGLRALAREQGLESKYEARPTNAA
jgi:hypothetical protein